MKLSIVLLAAAAAWAQPALKVAPAGGPLDKAPLSFAAMTDLEQHLDEKISKASATDPMLLLGESRTLYLTGYGAVITQEVSLVVSPMISAFKPKISPQEVVQTHQRKLAQLPLMRKTMQDMWAEAASTLTTVPSNEQIVLAVRLMYKSWEDTKGLPAQILLKGTRGAGLAGVQMEEQ